MTMDSDLDLFVLEDLVVAIGFAASADFVTRFIADCDQRVARILAAFAADDFESLALDAHTLGSSAATYGLRSVEVLCRKIENSEPTDWIEQDMDLLSAEAARGCAQLSEWLEEQESERSEREESF